MLRLNYAVASDRGLVRGNNEDSAYAGPHLIALADGMGGHAAGEVASQLMIKHLMPLDASPDDNDMLALLASGADDANRAIAQGVRDEPATNGMGTTLTAIMFNGTDLAMCHVGDSRGYRYRDGELEQITVDDTYVQSLVDKGELSPEDVSTHPQRSMILKAYTGRPVEPTLTMLEARAGDRLLLCSDGLSDPVTHSTIETAIAQGSPAEVARKLVDLALRSGGPDNVTVVVADIVEGPSDDQELPIVPVTAGALNGEQPEDPRPDTSAGRAAIVMAARQPQTIPARDAHTVRADQANAVNTNEPPTDGEKKSGRGKFWAGIITLLVIAAAIAGGWWAKTMVDNNYYVTTANEEGLENAIVIERGVDLEFFGKPLHSTYQYACLNSSGDLSLIPENSHDTCHRFRLKDLTESARSSVASLPEGNYNDVQQQVQQLANQLLPVCVTREAVTKPEEKKPEDQASNGAPPQAEANPAAPQEQEGASPSKKPEPGDLSTPGVTCREVK
ncbi:protein phosphatase 2C domain-containing protein [Corynebacterium pseudotuberculosis]|uniref:PP2C family protein-serine/threonine phosphatase n=1 Tax=Corynebacterium pseudotuberculosis TaxID=1719 RepID=UPI0005B34DF9|nr:protein phosphatase 2C domain-containing protein [Corynebacterium pseudotuberculosis]AMN69166.1 protein phosphatase [Corynebacterium pseudotuberculosis]AMN71001.1 protein phosphatase [Corynebacterium pseudotuberculosis]AMN74349.1 serine/threonine-protein phosphatase [Corynebacterium pseudotuberculosis]AMN74909.1 protein phosphatase [Corynebacterium pseudotuberculosis]ANZ91070.1 protein phosphatase [Corynebacterium pseudotuberculosis]